MPVSHPVPLAAVAGSLLVDFRPDATEGAWLVRVEGDGPEPAIGVHELEAGGAHPIDSLLGFVADPSWSAAGVLAHGTGRCLDGTPGQGGPAERARHLRCAYLVARDGSEASAVRHLDEPAPVPAPGPAEGRLVDCCRRILALPTAPPAHEPLHLFAARWLDAALEQVVAAPGRRWSWSTVAALHPLVHGSPGLPGTMARRVAAAAGPLRWADLRALADHDAGPGAVDAELAAWMDDGMFARELAAAVGDPVDLLIELAALLPGPTTEGIVEVLGAWGVW